MVPTACVSLADSGTSIVVDGCAMVLRALGSRSKAKRAGLFFQFFCSEAEAEGVQVTTVPLLVLGLASVGRQLVRLDLGSK